MTVFTRLISRCVTELGDNHHKKLLYSAALGATVLYLDWKAARFSVLVTFFIRFTEQNSGLSESGLGSTADINLPHKDA